VLEAATWHTELSELAGLVVEAVADRAPMLRVDWAPACVRGHGDLHAGNVLLGAGGVAFAARVSHAHTTPVFTWHSYVDPTEEGRGDTPYGGYALKRKSRSRETALSKTDLTILRLLHAP